jgi:hypothetical protein
VQEYDGFEPTWELQEQVKVDLFVIADYGERHANHFGGCWLHDRHLYGVSFTDSIDEHTAALHALVGLPERLLTGQCSHSLAALRETAKAIVQAGMQQGRDGTLVVTGVVGVAKRVKDNVVEVYLRPGHPEVEARLRATYGAMISVVPGAVSQTFSTKPHLLRTVPAGARGIMPLQGCQ